MSYLPAPSSNNLLQESSADALIGQRLQGKQGFSLTLVEVQINVTMIEITV